MRCATAIWNYEEPGCDLADLIDEFAGFGYDTISLGSWQLARLDARAVADHLCARGLQATMHCTFDTPVDDVCRMAGVLGDLLLTCTYDAVHVTDSRGTRYDLMTMLPALRRLLDATAGSAVRLGIEDFPLDQEALAFYRADLEALLASPRFGMLVDVGHMNMRLRQWPCYGGCSIAEYLARLPLRVWEVHLHDNSGGRDEHGHFGMGNVDFPAVAKGLKAIGFEGVSTIEIAPSFHGSTPRQSKPRAAESLSLWRAIWKA